MNYSAPGPQLRDVLIVNLTGIADLSSELVEVLTQAQAAGRDVEILNPSPEIQEYLRSEDLGSILIRGSTV
jgi:hypothetical protein